MSRPTLSLTDKIDKFFLGKNVSINIDTRASSSISTNGILHKGEYGQYWVGYSHFTLDDDNVYTYKITEQSACIESCFWTLRIDLHKTYDCGDNVMLWNIDSLVKRAILEGECTCPLYGRTAIGSIFPRGSFDISGKWASLFGGDLMSCAGLKYFPDLVVVVEVICPMYLHNSNATISIYGSCDLDTNDLEDHIPPLLVKKEGNLVRIEMGWKHFQTNYDDISLDQAMEITLLDIDFSGRIRSDWVSPQTTFSPYISSILSANIASGACSFRSSDGETCIKSGSCLDLLPDAIERIGIGKWFGPRYKQEIKVGG